MHSILTGNRFRLRQNQKEGFFTTSAAFSYDLLDDSASLPLVSTTEPALNWFTKLCRIDRRYRGYTPFHLTFATPAGASVMSIKRGWAYGALHRPAIEIRDEGSGLLGSLKQAFSPIHASFDLQDAQGKSVLQIKGDWADWDFRFVQAGRQIAFLTKGSGEGLLTELASTKDNYVLTIDEDVAADLRRLIIASAVAVDISRNE